MLLCCKEFESYLFYTLMWYEKQWVCEKDRERKLYVVENVKVIPANMEPADNLLGQAPIQVLAFHFRVFSFFLLSSNF